MKKLKKVIAGVAAVAALVAVPTATAMADEISTDKNETETSELGWWCGVWPKLPGCGSSDSFESEDDETTSDSDVYFSSLNVDGYQIDLDQALSEEGQTICVSDPSTIDPSLVSTAGSYKSYFYDTRINADGTTYTYRYYAVAEDGTQSDPYIVTFTSENCTPESDDETGDGEGENTGDGETDDNTGDDNTGDDENTGDDTTDGDDTVDEDDTTDGTENPSDDESDTDDTDDTEATSDEESESDDTSTLATTGSALLGIGVFALVALIGAGVVYTVRKRA